MAYFFVNVSVKKKVFFFSFRVVEDMVLEVVADLVGEVVVVVVGEVVVEADFLMMEKPTQTLSSSGSSLLVGLVMRQVKTA